MGLVENKAVAMRGAANGIHRGQRESPDFERRQQEPAQTGCGSAYQRRDLGHIPHPPRQPVASDSDFVRNSWTEAPPAADFNHAGWDIHCEAASAERTAVRTTEPGRIRFTAQVMGRLAWSARRAESAGACVFQSAICRITRRSYGEGFRAATMMPQLLSDDRAAAAKT
jgi:hypothetical protein